MSIEDQEYLCAGTERVELKKKGEKKDMGPTSEPASNIPERCRPLACCISQCQSVSSSHPCERRAGTVGLWRRGKRTPAGGTQRTRWCEVSGGE